MTQQTTDVNTAPIYTGPLPHVQTVERLPVTVYEQSTEASRAIAREIADLVRERAAAGKTTVLGLATGSTPLGAPSMISGRGTSIPCSNKVCLWISSQSRRCRVETQSSRL